MDLKEILEAARTTVRMAKKDGTLEYVVYSLCDTFLISIACADNCPKPLYDVKSKGHYHLRKVYLMDTSIRRRSVKQSRTLSCVYDICCHLDRVKNLNFQDEEVSEDIKPSNARDTVNDASKSSKKRKSDQAIGHTSSKKSKSEYSRTKGGTASATPKPSHSVVDEEDSIRGPMKSEVCACPHLRLWY